MRTQADGSRDARVLLHFRALYPILYPMPFFTILYPILHPILWHPGRWTQGKVRTQADGSRNARALLRFRAQLGQFGGLKALLRPLIEPSGSCTAQRPRSSRLQQCHGSVIRLLYSPQDLQFAFLKLLSQ